jgi:hypothetical protein
MAVGAVVVLADCGASTCGPETCGGCCAADGRCESGTAHRACGLGGVTCDACSAIDACVLGECTPNGGGDGGGAGGGVGGGGGGGGTGVGGGNGGGVVGGGSGGGGGVGGGGGGGGGSGVGGGGSGVGGGGSGVGGGGSGVGGGGSSGVGGGGGSFGGGAGGGGSGLGGGSAVRGWVAVPGLKPPPRFGAAMAFDSNRERTVLFGGQATFKLEPGAYLGDVWEYGPSGWVNLTPGTGPFPRSKAAMAYDPVRKKMVLFGGEHAIDNPDGGSPEVSVLGDLWIWNGTTWALAGVSAPTPRSYAGIAWDAHREKLVLYGGSNGVQALGDTWEWDGTGWVSILAPGSPPARWVYSLASDPTQGRSLFSSGFNPSGEQSGTWAYDGGSWVQANGSTTTPPPMIGGSLAYDGAGQQVLQVCGRATGVYLPTTWLWSSSNSTWTVGPALPSGRAWCATTYDARLGKVVLFGGSSGTVIFGDMLEY